MIQWFPGHMAKATRELERMAPIADLFIVVLDARAPLSSYNEDFDKIAPTKPRLFVITKQDLADQTKLVKLTYKFNHDKDRVVLVNLKSKTAYKKILNKANEALKEKKERDIKKGLKSPRLRAIVIGVPNSGKSTLINTLAKKNKTRVGNMPGVTRGQQWVKTGDIQLLDTPGILWPKFEDELIGVKLAIIGSIKMSVIPLNEIFYKGYELLSKYYPDKIKELDMEPSNDENEIFNQIHRFSEKKRFLLSNNRIDTNKGMQFFLNHLKKMEGVTYD